MHLVFHLADVLTLPQLELAAVLEPDAAPPRIHHNMERIAAVLPHNDPLGRFVGGTQDSCCLHNKIGPRHIEAFHTATEETGTAADTVAGIEVAVIEAVVGTTAGIAAVVVVEVFHNHRNMVKAAPVAGFWNLCNNPVHWNRHGKLPCDWSQHCGPLRSDLEGIGNHCPLARPDSIDPVVDLVFGPNLIFPY